MIGYDIHGKPYVSVGFLFLLLLSVCVTLAILVLIEKVRDEKFELRRRLVNHWHNLTYNRREIVALRKEVTNLKKQGKK